VRPEPTLAAVPPPAEWQELAGQVIRDCEARLWQPEGARALAWLREKRGLKDTTIQRFHLGYNPEGQKINGKYWLDRGITVPCVVGGPIWYVKVRLPAKPGELKYRCLTGSKPAALFNAADLAGAPVALLVEGEFDTMLAWQEFRDILPTATLGSATNVPDLATWGRYFLGPEKTLILPDNDEAGWKATETLCQLARFPIIVSLPDGCGCKDLTDFYLTGGDLSAWALNVLDFHDPMPSGGMVEAAPAMGGVVNEQVE